MRLAGDQLVALLVSISFAGVIALQAALQLLSSLYVIGDSSLLFALEFVAEKIPGFDLFWNAIHTFIRVPVAALLAYRATDSLAPWQQMAAAAAGGAIALIAHGGKTAARAAVTASP